MISRAHISRTWWTLTDQGVVSLGAFLLNVQLARGLPTADYGTFAVIFSLFMGLQILNASLIHHPLIIALVVAKERTHPRLVYSAFLINLACSALLAAILGLGLWLFSAHELVVPAAAAFFAWQMQEGMRRALISQYRHQAAIPGDAINYLGQAAAAGILLAHGAALPQIFFCTAAISALAAIVQAIQIPLRPVLIRPLRHTLADNWQAGNWILLYNLVSLARLQGLVWFVAALFGAPGAAHFQAALNVANLANPVVLGLCNVIPQAVSEQRRHGPRASWMAARAFGILGMLPTFGYYALTLVFPEVVLEVFYGTSSPYLGLTFLVRLLVAAQLLSYWADVMASYLNSTGAARTAASANVVSSLASISLALPFVPALGLPGAAGTIIAANAIRLFLYVRTVAQAVAPPEPHPPVFANKLLPRILPR